MMLPGFGVGGYCLTKDTLLAEWASKNLFERDRGLNLSLQAIEINDHMPNHTYNLIRRHTDVVKGKIAILGASYREDVDDTRNSPTVTLYDLFSKDTDNIMIHDPYAKRIERRHDIIVNNDLLDVLRDSEIVILVVRHDEYRNLKTDLIGKLVKKDGLVVDAFNILNDEKIEEIKKVGFKVLTVGKGNHMRDYIE
jgi:UDP-N-acetyl-D-mannosaminuronate dehydrogenase